MNKTHHNGFHQSFSHRQSSNHVLWNHVLWNPFITFSDILALDKYENIHEYGNLQSHKQTKGVVNNLRFHRRNNHHSLLIQQY